MNQVKKKPRSVRRRFRDAARKEQIIGELQELIFRHIDINGSRAQRAIEALDSLRKIDLRVEGCLYLLGDE